MIRLLWTASTEVRYFLRRYMPSNVLFDLIRRGCLINGGSGLA